MFKTKHLKGQLGPPASGEKVYVCDVFAYSHTAPLPPVSWDPSKNIHSPKMYPPQKNRKAPRSHPKLYPHLMSWGFYLVCPNKKNTKWKDATKNTERKKKCFCFSSIDCTITHTTLQPLCLLFSCLSHPWQPLRPDIWHDIMSLLRQWGRGGWTW